MIILTGPDTFRLHRNAFADKEHPPKLEVKRDGTDNLIAPMFIAGKGPKLELGQEFRIVESGPMRITVTVGHYQKSVVMRAQPTGIHEPAKQEASSPATADSRPARPATN